MKPFILFKVHITKLIGCQIASALMTKIGNKVIDIFSITHCFNDIYVQFSFWGYNYKC